MCWCGTTRPTAGTIRSRDCTKRFQSVKVIRPAWGIGVSAVSVINELNGMPPANSARPAGHLRSRRAAVYVDPSCSADSRCTACDLLRRQGGGFEGLQNSVLGVAGRSQRAWRTSRSEQIVGNDAKHTSAGWMSSTSVNFNDCSQPGGGQCFSYSEHAPPCRVG